MCTSKKPALFGLISADPASAAEAPMATPVASAAAASTAWSAGLAHALPGASSRRRRLWDLDRHAHCPLVGVCLPMAALRRLVDKVSGRPSTADDYDLHSSVVGECRSRTVLSEALQKHLDQRYALALQRAGRIKSTEALSAWWAEASAGRELPAAFWAVLTHPRCDSRLEYLVLGQVHMLQHQVGMATRVELARFEALIDENAVLGRELAATQQRSQRLSAEWATRVAQLEAELVRQRGATLARDTQLAQQQELLATLEAASPQLRQRHSLAQDNRLLREQVQELQRTLSALREQLRRAQQPPGAPARPAAALAGQALPSGRPGSWPDAGGAPQGPFGGPQLSQPVNPPAQQTVSAGPAQQRAEPGTRPLADQAVLCVGGRQASVPLYRLVIERTGGRFLHHDGGEQDSPSKLDATLAAADLVICQTGCVSHDAYWRVKDHCKRTGKRCMFVETPSRAALERALAHAVADTAVAAPPLADLPSPER